MMLAIIFVLTLVIHASGNDTCPKCGSIEVPYPLSTNENCGDPRYKVYCKNNVLQLQSAEGFYYKIISIIPSSYKLVISPPSTPKDTCFSSDLSLGGFRLDDDSPFNISTRNTVMLFNCSENILLSPLNCSLNSFCRLFEEQVEEGSGCRETLCCHFLKDSSMTARRIRVRVGGCTAYTSVVDLEPRDSVDSWKYGIELQWLPAN